MLVDAGMDADRLADRLERAQLSLERAVDNQAMLPTDEALDYLKAACEAVSKLLKDTIVELDSDPDQPTDSSSLGQQSGSVDPLGDGHPCLHSNAWCEDD